jgi:hypothetical protein
VFSSSRLWFTRLAVAMALWPASAEAQTEARSFEELIGIVQAEETVIVTDRRGRKVKGALIAVDEGLLSLATDGRTRTFPRSEVSSVRVTDGLGNGALIGAGAGFGAAVATTPHAFTGSMGLDPSCPSAFPVSSAACLLGAICGCGSKQGLAIQIARNSNPEELQDRRCDVDDARRCGARLDVRDEHARGDLVVVRPVVP